VFRSNIAKVARVCRFMKLETIPDRSGKKKAVAPHAETITFRKVTFRRFAPRLTSKESDMV